MKKYFFLILVLTTGCAGLGKRVIYPSEVEPAMQAAFERAENFYKGEKYAQALEAYRQYITGYPYNQLSDEASYKIGKIHFLNKNWNDSIIEFDALTKKSPDPVYRAKALLMSGYASMKKGDFDRADQSLNRLEEDDLPLKMKVQLYSLKIFVGEKRNLGRSDMDYHYLRLADLYLNSADPEMKELRGADLISSSKVMDAVRAFVISPISAENIPGWFRNYPSGPSRGYVDYKWGKIFYEAERKEEARRKLSQFIHAYPKHEYADSARQLLSELGGELEEEKEGKEFKIGVLLPLAGPQSTYGQAVLWGIECAAGLHPGCEPLSYKISGDVLKANLIVKNSGSTPEEVVSALDQLADSGVAAIIGPVSGPLAEAAAKRAQDLKEILLPITQKDGVMGLGDYIFQMGYISKQQVHDLVVKARGRGIRSFGVFYPNISYGQEMADLFETIVKEQGGRLSAKSAYSQSSPDMGGEARKLKMGMSRVSAEGGNVGFGALFIPDSYRAVNRIIEGLQFVSIDGIPLLGTNAWNDSQLSVSSAGSYPGSFFMDIFYHGSTDPLTLKFVQAYRQTFGRSPTSLEALGYDALHFVERAAEAANSTKPSRVREALSTITDFAGVTRIRGFKEGEGPVVEPYMLRVGEGGIQQFR